MLSTFGERGRNLADQSHQREAGIPTSWWKLISVVVSPDLMRVHTHPNTRRTGLKKKSHFV